jgi:hypothetical protein
VKKLRNLRGLAGFDECAGMAGVLEARALGGAIIQMAGYCEPDVGLYNTGTS